MLVRPAPPVFREFLESEAFGGLLLIGAAGLALVAANMAGTAPTYESFVHARVGPMLSPKLGVMTVHLWVNDALMALFFLLVGLEIKREWVTGRLADPAARRLPILAALAGMAAPALVYLAIAGTGAGLWRGWAIPAATDIAFAIGVLALLGPRAPASLKLFLTTVAIVDDMGAVAIIAFVYTRALDLMALGAAAAIFAGMVALNRKGVTRLGPYLLGFGLLWYALLLSGVHATIAGVLAAFTVPVGHTDKSPLHRLEHTLAPWVAYAIVPLFGFVNAGVALSGGAFLDPVPLAVGLGLVLGKQFGIFGAVWGSARLGLASRPAGASWAQLYGVALLCGIGFTMSLFIGALAFPHRPALVEEAKLGVLAGSFLSALTGFAVLRFAAPARPER